MDANLSLGQTRARWAIRALYLSVALAALAVLSDYLQWHLLHQTQSGVAITPEAAASNDSRYVLIARLQLASFLLCIPTFLIWWHRAYANLGEVFGQKTELTPGWAVGYWFIPIINIIRPYQTMKELWIKSQGDQATSAPSAVRSWWLAYLVSGGLARVSSSWGERASGIPDLLAVTIVGALGDLFTLIAGLLLIGLIREVNAAQQRRGS